MNTIERKVKGSAVAIEAPSPRKAVEIVFVRELAEYNGAGLQTRDYATMEVKVNGRKGIICGYCFAPWNRSKETTASKQRVPQRECSKCKVLLCGHRAYYCGAAVGSRCVKHRIDTV